MFTAAGAPVPQFSLAIPSGYKVDDATQEFIPNTPGATQLSIGLYQDGVLYLSPYSVGSGLEILVASLGHELAHIWLAATDPTDAGNDNWNETFAYYYEASIWEALGNTDKANTTKTFADNLYGQSLSNDQKFAILDKLQASTSPQAPKTPCQ